MIPIIPTIREETIEKIIIGSTRATRGLPQPGLSRMLAMPVRTAKRSNVSAIFPNRILTFSEKANKVFYTISLSAVVESVNRGIF